MLQPVDLRSVGTAETLITWQDGHRSLYVNRELRFHCGCAGCVDEMTGKRKIQLADVAHEISSREYENVGNYGIKFYWSDGHHTGIYSYEMLRRLCPCQSCRQKQVVK